MATSLNLQHNLLRNCISGDLSLILQVLWYLQTQSKKWKFRFRYIRFDLVRTAILPLLLRYFIFTRVTRVFLAHSREHAAFMLQTVRRTTIIRNRKIVRSRPSLSPLRSDLGGSEKCGRRAPIISALVIGRSGPDKNTKARTRGFGISRLSTRWVAQLTLLSQRIKIASVKGHVRY